MHPQAGFRSSNTTTFTKAKLTWIFFAWIISGSTCFGGTSTNAQAARARAIYTGLPLTFLPSEPNPTSRADRFTARGTGYGIEINRKGAVLSLAQGAGNRRSSAVGEELLRFRFL